MNHLDLWVMGGIPGINLSFPHVLGADGCGVVVEVAKGVTQFREGDEVVLFPAVSCEHCEHCLSGTESLCRHYKILGEHVLGTHSEFVVACESRVFNKPKNLTFEEVASLPLVFVTAWQMVLLGALTPLKKVLIHGAGSGVSLALIQLAKLQGARVLVTSRSEEKLKRALSLGADEGWVTSDLQWFKAVKQWSGDGFDVIFDHIGCKFWSENLKLIKWGGKLITCGATSGHEVNVDLRQVFFKQLQILGSTMGSSRDFRSILDLFEAGKLKPIVDSVFPISDYRNAFLRVMNSEQCGKVVMVF